MDDDALFDEPFHDQESMASFYQKPTPRSDRKAITIEKPDITLSPETEAVLDRLENTSDNIFLTGRAGTGKSTLLNYFRATTKKNIAVVAPTGVAAVNVNGETIHHFFKFGIGMTQEQIRKVGGERAKVFTALDMLVIDEVSMVRADLFDCVEKFLRLNGREPHKPFGGVQILLIGDLYQLPPVVMPEERSFFEGFYYQSPFFFDARAYATAQCETVELTQVYRQTDTEFIAALDAIRTAQATEEHVALINTRIDAQEKSGTHLHVALVPLNVMADTMNARYLVLLEGEARVYAGLASPGFNEKEFPTAKQLQLKKGAQVMLLNNDQRGRWVNGDIATVASMDGDGVQVVFEDGRTIDVRPYTWEKVQFAFNEETQRIEPTPAGSFTQLPLKLAWAVTIHKGQGKTYDRVAIDFGTGMFAPGQAYVALSRCRSLEGLSLKSPLRSKHIFTDPRIDEFMQGRDDSYQLEAIDEF